MRQLAHIINSKGTESTLIINTVDPGLCHSELARELGFQLTIQKPLLARSAEDGSRKYVIAASLGNESNGKYISYYKVSYLLSKCPLYSTVLLIVMINRESPFVNGEDGARTGERL